jgi:scyllo-inositol 2-dehydrogenase (NADP+)
MSDMIEVGVVGYGLAGRVFHAPFIEAHPLLRVAGIVTANPERAARAAREHPGAAVVAAIDDLPPIGLLVIASPPHLHESQAMWSIARRVPFVIDKPFMPDSASAERVMTAAEHAGVPLTVYQNRRWDGDFATVGEVVASGALGDVFEFDSAFEHWDPHPASDWKAALPVTQGGGVTMDLGSHLVDQAIQLFGAVASVEADLRTLRAGAANDDVASVALVHESGVRSRLRMSRLGAVPLPRFRVAGDRGGLRIEGLDPQEGLLADGVPASELGRVQRDDPRTARLVTASGTTQIALHAGRYGELYESIAEWASGRAPAPVDPRSALDTLKILERATAAAR